MVGHKTSLKIEIIQSILSDHNEMKLEIFKKGKQKIHEYVKIKQYTIKQAMGQRRCHEEIRKYLVMNENENTTHKTWDTEKKELREKYIALMLTLRRPQINNLMSYLKKLEKEEQTKWKTSKKKEIRIIRMNINEIENKKFKNQF